MEGIANLSELSKYSVVGEENFIPEGTSKFDFSIEVPDPIKEEKIEDKIKEDPKVKKVEIEQEDTEYIRSSEEELEHLKNIDDSTEEEEEDIKKEGEETEFSILAKDWQERGLLELPEDFDGSEEKFREAFELTKNKQVEETIVDIFKNHPQAELGTKLFNYIREGKDINTFLEVYSNPLASIDLTKEGDQERVIRHELKLTNPKISNEKIDQRIEQLKNAALLEEYAKDAFENLKSLDEQSRKQKEEAENERIQTEKEQRENTIKEITEFINKNEQINELFDIRSKKEKQQFLDYLFKPSVKVGNRMYPQAVVDEEELSLNNYLARQYFQFKKFKIDGVVPKIEKKVKSEIAERLSKLPKKSTPKGTGQVSEIVQRKQQSTDGKLPGFDAFKEYLESSKIIS